MSNLTQQVTLSEVKKTASLLGDVVLKTPLQKNSSAKIVIRNL